MSNFDPKVDFGALEESDIATIGLDAAEVAFVRDVAAGLTNGDSLIITVGYANDGDWHETGRRAIGPDAEQYAGNIDPVTGKLATALSNEMESVAAYELFGNVIPEGAQRFTGGVYYTARVQTIEHGWLNRDFAGAASGVQGHIDAATVYTALLRMAAAWALKMQALYGTPA